MTSPNPPLTQLRTLASALTTTPLVILLALWFVLAPRDGLETPPLWAPLAVAAVAAAGFGLIGVVGYRTTALPVGLPADEAARRGVQAFQALMLVRFALGEAAMLVGVVLGFVVEQGGFLVVLVGVACTLAVAVVHVLPNDGQVERVQSTLEAGGARIPLREALQGD